MTQGLKLQAEHLCHAPSNMPFVPGSSHPVPFSCFCVGSVFSSSMCTMHFDIGMRGIPTARYSKFTYECYPSWALYVRIPASIYPDIYRGVQMCPRTPFLYCSVWHAMHSTANRAKLLFRE